MKKYILATIIALFACTAIYAQKDEQKAPVFNWAVVESLPLYTGCPTGMSNDAKRTCMSNGINKHIAENFEIPKKARKKKIEGKVYVSFVIEKDGTISNVLVVRGVHKLLDEEAVRVVKSIPRFDQPATQDGEAVRMQYTIPINVKY